MNRAMDLPDILNPSCMEKIFLGNNVIEVPKATPSFLPWAGPRPKDTKGGKLLLDFKGNCTFAELFILWSLMDMGWNGVWIDNWSPRGYRHAYWGVPPIKELPPEPTEVIMQIGKGREFVGGTWDLFCWRSKDLLFVESKQKGKDGLNATQVEWLQRALECNLRIENFLVVEWQIKEE